MTPAGRSSYAYVDGPFCDLPPTGTGALDGLTFAVKDLIDVAGWPTGAGNPDWGASHPVPERHAPVVARLLGCGAHLRGKTRTDEISLGILGENAHFGMPVNPAAPDRMPGGSSSGSAAAVAAGDMDFALGTDTGGSVRVPASFCGIHGIRPTHGRVDFTGVVAQAQDFDTLGWFARDAEVMARVGEALLCDRHEPLARFRVAQDAFLFADDAVRVALAPAIRRLGSVLPRSEDVLLAPQGLSVWQLAQRVLQSSQAARSLQTWLQAANPRLSFNVAQSLMRGLAFTDAERGRAALMQHEARQRMMDLLADDTAIAIPTTPFSAPLRTARPDGFALDRISCLTSIAGLSGLPQVSLPWQFPNGLPIGLSLVGAPDSDMALLAAATAFGALDD